MNILVIGSGGREHALSWALSRSEGVGVVYCVPGNPGVPPDGEPVEGRVDDFDGLVDLARRLDVELTVVGPEAPLCSGIVDRFDAEGLAVVGPTKEAARLEGSKVFAKEFMERHVIPTASFGWFDDRQAALAYAKERQGCVVVKADGLAAGKGVTVCRSMTEVEAALEDALGKRRFGNAGDRVVIEELLVGQEASFMVLCDGERVLPLASAQDHKPLLDGDQGPNTGGMGAYSPAPVLTDALEQQVLNSIVRPTIRGMTEEGHPYRGVLYVGLMLTESGPKVLEYNCRFGDPETQPVLMRLGQDLLPLLEGTRTGLPTEPVRWKPETAVCVVMASSGYPGAYEKGFPISGIEEAEGMDDVKVFRAGVVMDDGASVASESIAAASGTRALVTAGGRVLGVTALGRDVAAARDLAYEAVAKIHWDGAQYRRDIAAKALPTH